MKLKIILEKDDVAVICTGIENYPLKLKEWYVTDMNTSPESGVLEITMERYPDSEKEVSFPSRDAHETPRRVPVKSSASSIKKIDVLNALNILGKATLHDIIRHIYGKEYPTASVQYARISNLLNTCDESKGEGLVREKVTDGGYHKYLYSLGDDARKNLSSVLKKSVASDNSKPVKRSPVSTKIDAIAELVYFLTAQLSNPNGFTLDDLKKSVKVSDEYMDYIVEGLKHENSGLHKVLKIKHDIKVRVIVDPIGLETFIAEET